MKKNLIILVFLIGINVSYSQTQFWVDNFESSPSGGTRTPEENGGLGGPPNTSYFRLTDGSTVSQAIAFTGKEGTNYWAGEDHNAAGTGFVASGAEGAATNSALNELTISWTGINISGKSGMSFRGLFAANSSNEPWDNLNACISGVGTTNTDYIIVQYRIDGGAYTDLIRFFNKGSASGLGHKYLFEDTDGNGCGEGTQLTNVFGEFTKTIAGTGTTLDIRVNVYSEGNNEEWGVDNFRLFETAACPSVTLTPLSQTNVSCFGGSNGAASLTSSGGSGFTYNWLPGNPTGDGTASVAGLTAGTWSCVVTNSCSNTNTLTFNITQPTAISLNAASQTNVACNGGSNGAASVSTSGGAGGYTYNWTPGNPTGDGTTSVTGLTAGTWTCTVTDANSCTNTRTFNITQPTAIAVTPVSQTNISCNGGANGAAQVSVSGGQPSYSYNWTPGNPTGDGTASVTGLTAGTWTCTVTDANSCTNTQTFNITQPTGIAVTPVSQTNISCNGGANGAAQVSVSGGQPSYSYNWTPGNPTGDGTTSVTGLTAGTWTCTVTDANACTNTQTFNITQPSAISLNAASQTNIACNGGSNGAASVSPASGGAGGYTYNWTPGNPTGDGTTSITGLTAGTWTCTVTDANSCTNSQTFNITQSSAISISPVSQTNISCNGGSNGAASVSTSGGAGGYTYNWTPGNPTGDGTTSVTGLTAGTWTCTVTDANACTNTQTFNITQPTAISLNAASQTNISCNGGSNGAASVSAATGGAGGYTYNWTPGNPTGDGTTSVTGLTAGTWTCTVTDANACTNTQTFNITQSSAISLNAASQTNIACNGGSNGAASVSAATGGAGGYTYNWTPGNPTGDGTTSVTGLTAGAWTCTVTDANSCTKTQTFNITQPTAIAVTPVSQTNISCNGGANGAAQVSVSGGQPSYSYNWTPGNPTGDGTASVTGLTAGTWTCTVTDANSCTKTQTFNVTQPTAISLNAASQTNIACNGGSNGAASVSAATGGAGGYTYNWTPGNPTGDGTTSVTGLTAGTWTCTATDANSCTKTQTFNITQPSALVTSTAVTNVLCNGGAGSATITTSGGAGSYTYLWSSAATTSVVSSLLAGVYTATVTDANSCTSTKTVTITQPTTLIASITSTSTACLINNGSAAVVASGGTSGYTYSWSPTGGTGSTATGLGVGIYSCIIRDANLCSITKTVNITTSGAPTATVTSQTNVTCNGACNGAATVTASGGTTPYTYSWSNGNTASVATGLCPGPYTVTVTGNNGCSVVTTVTITQPTVLLANVSASSILCNGGVSTVTVSATGGTPSYSGVGTFTASAGIKTYTVTDGNSCSITTSISISQPAALSANSTASSILCNGGVSTITVSATGGTPSYSGVGTFTAVAGTSSYTITDGNSCSTTTSVSISQPLAIVGSQTITLCEGQSIMIGTNTYTATGIYIDVLAAANSCDSTLTTDLTVNSLPVVVVNSGVICNGQSFTMTPSGAITYTYSSGSDVVSPTSNATYTVNGTDANGCISIGTIGSVTVNALPTLMATTNNSLLCTGETATLSVMGASSYTWNTTENTTDIAVTPTATTTYTVDGTDANGCLGSITITQDVSLCTGVVNISGNATFIAIYPNPNNGLFNIELSATSKVSITNALGQVIISETMEEGKHNLDIQNQSTGIYFVKVIQDDKQYITKLIKE